MNRVLATARLRVVLDTNIYIAAFGHPKGRNATLWAAALAGRYRLLISPAIVRELARVLRTDLQWQEEYVQSRVRIVAQVAELISPRAALQVVTADPTDDRILECAVDGKADLIVSNDHHLLDLGSYGDIPIVARPDFRSTLGLR
jgi:putative PIN family toxin of toxin-antitoxin system